MKQNLTTKHPDALYSHDGNHIGNLPFNQFAGAHMLVNTERKNANQTGTSPETQTVQSQCLSCVLPCPCLLCCAIIPAKTTKPPLTVLRQMRQTAPGWQCYSTLLQIVVLGYYCPHVRQSNISNACGHTSTVYAKPIPKIDFSLLKIQVKHACKPAFIEGSEASSMNVAEPVNSRHWHSPCCGRALRGMSPRA